MWFLSNKIKANNAKQIYSLHSTNDHKKIFLGILEKESSFNSLIYNIAFLLFSELD